MKSKRMVLVSLTLIADLVVGLGFARAAEPKASEPGDTGGAVGAMKVEAATTTAVVMAIDYPTRMITLRRTDGAMSTFHVGLEVQNFDQIKVGDQVKATTMKSLAITTRKPGQAPGPAAQQTVAVAPKGAMPGVLVANTAETTARIVAIDPRTRKVELQTPDGKDHTVHVGPNVDLGATHEGDDVVVRSTERLLLRVERGAESTDAQTASANLRNMIVTEGITTDATITALDKARRTITLKRPDGSEQTFRAGKGVDNLDPYQVGDEVKARLIEELAIAIDKPDAAAAAEKQPDSVALAPGDALSSVAMAPVRQETLKIRAIDAEERDVTFQDANGQARIIEVAPRVNLATLKAGDDVVVRMTPGVIVALEKSQ